MASIGDRYALIGIWAFYTAPPEACVSSTLTGDYNLHRPKARKELAMTNYTIKLENGAFNFYEDDNLVKENLKVRTVKKENDVVTVGDIILPENSYGKKSISTTRFKNGITEVNLADCPCRVVSSITKSPKAKVNLDEYLTDEEKSEIEKHKKAIDDIYAAVNERAKKDIQMAELKAMLAAFTPEEIARLMGKA